MRTRTAAVMATAELVIVIPLFIAGAFFLGDLSQVGICREKLSDVLKQTANYAVNLSPDVDPAQCVPKVVKELCAKNNLHIRNLKIEVKETTVADVDAISVKATADIPLLAGSFLPSVTTISDTATALIPANRICAAVAINPYPYSIQNPSAGASVYVPIIRPRSGLPIWQFPYDYALNNLHVVQGAVPPAPQPMPTGSYFADRPSVY